MGTGLADGVAYYDRLTRAPRKIRAKVVVLSASTLESTRILLNSGDGFCNSSGALGHYVMDHMYGGVSGVLPVKESKRWAGPPQRPNGLYLPRYLNVERPHTNGMIRGFGAQMRNGSSHGSPAAISAIPGFGAGFKRAPLTTAFVPRVFEGSHTLAKNNSSKNNSTSNSNKN